MLQISPSKLARYFYHECDRYLVYYATAKKEHITKGIPQRSENRSPVTKAILEAGLLWEEEVVKNYLKHRVRIADNNQEKLRNCKFDEPTTIYHLNTIKPEEYIYQGNLRTPDSFYEKYKLDKHFIDFSMCQPDLIYAYKQGNDLLFKIIDVKASYEMKMYHKIQVAIYAIILSHVIIEREIKGKVDFSSCGIWTYGLNEPQWFDVEAILPQVEEIIYAELPRLAMIEPGKANWHINYRCEWCEYCNYCINQAEQTQSVSLLPSLTSYGRKHLASDNIEVHTLQDMRDFLRKDICEEYLSQCASLCGKRSQFSSMIESILDGKIRHFNSSSSQMPVYEDIKFILTIQQEHISGKIYTIAFLCNGLEDIPGFKKNYYEKQWVAETPEDCNKIRDNFISSVYDLFIKIADYNKNSGNKSLQTYVFDLYEKDLLRELLIDGLKDTDISEKALILLSCFHSEELFSSTKHPEIRPSKNIPVVIVSEVIRTLFALPLKVSYKISELYNILVPENQKIPGKRENPRFTFRFFNAMKSEAIYDTWYNGNTEEIEKIARELRNRLWDISYIIEGIKIKVREFETWRPLIFTKLSAFNLPAYYQFNDKILSRLAFITAYENTFDYLEIVSNRALQRDEKERRGMAVSVVYIGDYSFSVNTTDTIHNLERNKFWLLTEDNEEGEVEQIKFNDLKYKMIFSDRVGENIYAIKIDNVYLYEENYIIRITSIKRNNHNFSIGVKYLLQPRFVDWNSDKVISNLKLINNYRQHREDHILELIKNPLSWCRKITEEKDIYKEIMTLIEKVKFTQTQKHSFFHLFNNSLTLIWGPPGTGKTYFIAIALLCLLEAHRIAGKPFKIFLSAFTHTAIENCLNKAFELNKIYKIWKEEGYFAKLDNIEKKVYNEINIIKSNDCYDFLSSNERYLAGGTTYITYKIYGDSYDRPFDLVVLDEGSQVRAGESLLPIFRLKPEGRLLIAGDDKQLPPVIKGYYPDTEPDEPVLNRSIFETLREPDRKQNKITCQLLENFRMNSNLCLYPALKIYGKEYKSANSQIGERKISLIYADIDIKHKEIVDSIIDPSYPLILCIMEGIRAAAKNTLEADIVADISLILRKSLCKNNFSATYEFTAEGDKEFWKEGLFIVTPHHVQRRAIREALATRQIERNAFVDTVDKMQGQECNAVIVSYGVADPELAIQEVEFIYSLNRLNVSITRAKAKTIVFLSRNLLTPSVRVFDEPKSIPGISYMIELEQFMAENNTPLVFDLKETRGGKLMVYRK